VAGKGMPAALFMVKVHTLSRHLVSRSERPAATLDKLNAALAANNFSGLFVTLIYGIYDPRSGEVVLSSGGHPMPLLRRADGQVEEIAVHTGRLLGYEAASAGLADTTLKLARGETLILYTDGFTEAYAPGRVEMFGLERLRDVLGGPRTQLTLEACAEEARLAIERFTSSPEQQDDLTLLLLRRL
jgi:phosphoserine phosphatase RsbU/P